MQMAGLDLWRATQLIHAFEVDLDCDDEVNLDAQRVNEITQQYEEVRRTFATFTDPPDTALRHRRISLGSALAYDIRWDEEDGCWILPIRSASGSLLGWQCKRGNEVWTEPTGTKVGSTLFGLDRLRTGLLALLVESPLDVAVLHEAGFRNQAVAAFGSAVGNERLKMLRAKTDRLCICLDNDIAGRQATERLLFDRRVGFNELTVINYRHSPQAKDPGDMTRDELEIAVQVATPARCWLIQDGAGLSHP
jgi:hypothetical protein